ncbi:hypothetical protein AOX55_0000731 [Sinorhizobium fredii CCBAU 25509]|nr:hypothetical protein AOX55_0000731 [Sinorhizobium fredii CCBAU 25509]
MPDQIMRAEDELGTDSLHDSTVGGAKRIVEFFGRSPSPHLCKTQGGAQSRTGDGPEELLRAAFGSSSLFHRLTADAACRRSITAYPRPVCGPPRATERQRPTASTPSTAADRIRARTR